MKTELEKIKEAMKYFKHLEEEERIRNARDEEQLERLLQLREALTK
jgi:hypothetical protein